MPFIPLEVYANNPSTTVSAGGTTAPAGGTVETWTVASSSSFPPTELGATQFHVADPALPSEMITVANVSGTSWTVTRGAESTTPVAHAAGFTVVQVVTAGVLAGLAYPAWQFPVQAYGAQGDGKIGTGGTGTSGTATFTDAGASFINAAAPAGDVGKVIIINQGTGSATVATNPFVGTIIAVNSATSVTLNANLAATCAAAPYIYGTDDAAAINAAILAAAQWAVTTGNYKAQVMFEPQMYMLGALVQSTAYQWSPFNTGLSYTYNTHIPIPFTGQYARKLIVDLIGVGDASEPDFWGSSVPSVQGTCLVSAAWAASEPNATFGQMSVMGGPATQANIGTGGVAGAGFANVLVNVTGITVITPFNTQQYSYDFRWCAQANIQNAAAIAFAPVNYNAQTVGGTWLRASNIPSNTVAVALAMPASQNNDNCNVGLFSAEGISIGVLASEHFTATRLATIYCNIGMLINWLSTGSIIHGGSVLYWTCEGCNTGVSTGGQSGSQQYSLFIGSFDGEVNQVYYVDDTGNNLTGTMYWYDLTQYSPVTGGPSVNGAQHYNIINTRMYPGPWVANASLGIAAPPAAPATGVAQQNISYRDATIYASAATSITGVSVGPASSGLTALGLAAGAGVKTSFRVPGGHWFSVAYTGTLTLTWVLE
jgi:hypothetical protein